MILQYLTSGFVVSDGSNGWKWGPGKAPITDSDSYYMNLTVSKYIQGGYISYLNGQFSQGPNYKPALAPAPAIATAPTPTPTPSAQPTAPVSKVSPIYLNSVTVSTAGMDLSGGKIINLIDSLDDQSATTKKYVDIADAYLQAQLNGLAGSDVVLSSLAQLKQYLDTTDPTNTQLLLDCVKALKLVVDTSHNTSVNVYEGSFNMLYADMLEANSAEIDSLSVTEGSFNMIKTGQLDVSSAEIDALTVSDGSFDMLSTMILDASSSTTGVLVVTNAASVAGELTTVSLGANPDSNILRIVSDVSMVGHTLRGASELESVLLRASIIESQQTGVPMVALSVLDMCGNKVQNLAPGTAVSDAATIGQLSSQIGGLTAQINALQANLKQLYSLLYQVDAPIPAFQPILPTPSSIH